MDERICHGFKNTLYTRGKIYPRQNLNPWQKRTAGVICTRGKKRAVSLAVSGLKKFKDSTKLLFL